ncbi:aluminum-activated malate transporter 8-like [Andrographis paniculata]|uniref:aluminum-activated malate transporter 8-like n=1 Tax=Andrographis paniculata TaxID=175694 RepID=UPI0021E77FF8|nr:aluminum-activated malate transporter 8-like [Andrographis paniculata]
MDIQESSSNSLGQRTIAAAVKIIPRRVKSTVMEARRIGREDPRRIVHSIKVGLALTLVSLLYYFRPLYDGFGQAGMWAILTVVVVFEYTVGGTLLKSINRGCATMAAGGLGIAAEYFAGRCGEKGEPIVLGILVFFLAAAASFMRFFPKVKRRYDYGVMIFILTFSLVAVSGFRVTEILELAHQRLSTILIGGATCIMISISVCPVWAGQDLHNLIAGNVEKLAVFLEGFGDEEEEFLQEIIKQEQGKIPCKKSFLQTHKFVLNSKATEESLVNFAWWEPCHGRFKFRHPWKQYLKIGAQARECAYLIQTLIGYINTKSQPKVSSDLQLKIQRLCIKISKESGKAMKELSSSVKNMIYPSPRVSTHAINYRSALDELTTILENSTLPTKADLQDILPALVIASVLTDIVNFVDLIAVSVDELAQKAQFKKLPNSTAYKKQHHSVIVKPVVIKVDASPEKTPEKENTQGTVAGQ